MPKRRVLPVQNNEEKQETYKVYKSQLSKAIRNEFYLEAMMIEYAVLEDRMRSFIYHIGGLPNRTSTKINSKRTKGHLKKIVSEYRTPDEKDNLGITNITGKEKIIRCVLRWVLDDTKEVGDDKYLTMLNRQVNDRIDVQELLRLLECIDDWCEFRNEVVHALMNKSITSLNAQLGDRAREGKQISEEMAGYIVKIKYGNRIRRAAGQKTE